MYLVHIDIALKSLLGALIVVGTFYCFVAAGVKGISLFLGLHSKRPLSIVTNCIILLILEVLSLKDMMLPKVTYSLPEIIVRFLGAIALGLWIWGIWSFKKWGVIGLAVQACAIQLIGIISGHWSAFYLCAFVPVIVAGKELSKMT